MSLDLRKPRRRPFKHVEAWEAHALALMGRYCLLQDDQAIANAPGATVRADINNNLQALVTLSSGATAPGTTWAYQLWADTTAALLKQRNAANSAWLVRGTLAETFVLARSSNTILAGADYGRTFNCTSSFTQTFTAAATLADGWWCEIRNANAAGGGVITLDPNAAETIDGATTIVLNPGESCIVNCNGASFATVGRQSGYIAMPAGHLFGLTLSRNATITKLDVAAGKCRDSTDAADIVLTAAITAGAIVSPWAAGSTQNKLDTGTVAINTWYHVWAIRKDSDGTGDWLFSASATAPTMPSGYTFKRRLGAIRTDGTSNVTAFTQDGDYFRWAATVLDVNSTNPGVAAVSNTITVPTGVNVIALVNGYVTGGATATTVGYLLSDLAANDEAPSETATPLMTAFAQGGTTATFTVGGQHQVRTNTSAQIRSRQKSSDANTIFRLSTFGWLDRRGRDA